MVTPGSAASIATYVSTYGFADTHSVFPYGVAYDASDKTVLAGNYWNFKIERYTAAGAHVATYKNAAGSGVGAPYDIAIDPNDTSSCGAAGGQCSDFWVADQEQGDVVEFDHTGHVVRTLGHDGTGNYHHGMGCGGGLVTFPTHLTIDPSNGNLYISDVRCKNVWEFAHDGTFIRAFDWSGWKKATGFFTPTPRGIQMDENGNIYVLELNSKAISVFNKLGQFQRIFPSTKDLSDPRGLDIDTTHHVLYAVGALRQKVLKYNYQGQLLKEWDSPKGTNGVKTDPKFNSIRAPAVDPATGDVFLGDTWGYVVYKSDANGSPLPWSSPPSPPANGGFTQQTGVAVTPDGTLYVAGSFDQRVQAFNTASSCPSEANCPAFKFAFGTRVNPAPNATGFDYPKPIFYLGGLLWIGENDGNDIQIYKPDGTWMHRFGTQGPEVGSFKQGVQGLYLDGNGHVFATDVGNCRLQVFSQATVQGQTSGQPIDHMGGCGNNNGQMSAPRGVVAEGSTAYVLESGASKISVWNWQTSTETATYKPNCGGTGLSNPWDAAWDPSHTWIYIGDKGHSRVVRWNPATKACDVVTDGSGTPVGHFKGPDFLNFGPDGKLYVSDNTKHVFSFHIN